MCPASSNNSGFSSTNKVGALKNKDIPLFCLVTYETINEFTIASSKSNSSPASNSSKISAAEVEIINDSISAQLNCKLWVKSDVETLE